MYDVVLLTLGASRDAPRGCADSAGGGGSCCGSGATNAAADCADPPRVPVLTCSDALVAAGARVKTRTARSDTEIDEILASLDGPSRPDGLAWPDGENLTRLIVATASDGQLRAVMRRLVRRYAPPPSRRPDDLAANRTVPDLPPIGVLPLDPTTRPHRADADNSATRIGTDQSDGGQADPAEDGTDLAGRLGLPRDPARVAAAVLAGRVRRFDLLRNDGGSVTLDGALIGGADHTGRPLPWRGRVEVDDAVLSAGDDPLFACVVANAAGYAVLEGLPLLAAPDPTDGVVEVAVALPVAARSRSGADRVRLEVRRARGRAVSVTPLDGEVPYLDDGATGALGRKRSWWIEPAAWAAYVD